MDKKQIKLITVLTVFLLISLTIVSIFGSFVPATYARDSASIAAQGMGQDIVDLFIVVPLLLISLVYMRKGNRIATLLFGGTVFYILYSFVIYCFGVYFNSLFLHYCITLGLSLYLFIIYLMAMQKMDVKSWFSEKLPVKLFAYYLIIIAVLFYGLWLKDVLPAIIGNYTPKSVSDYDLLVNPVHVIDIAIALPGLIVSAILLLKKQALGYIIGAWHTDYASRNHKG